MTADLPYLLNALFLASLNPGLLLPYLHFPLLTHKENITEYCAGGRGLQEGKLLESVSSLQTLVSPAL